MSQDYERAIKDAEEEKDPKSKAKKYYDLLVWGHQWKKSFASYEQKSNGDYNRIAKDIQKDFDSMEDMSR